MKHAVRLVVVAVAAISLGTACSSSSPTAAGSTSSSGATPEDQRAPDSAVAAGLRQIDGIATRVADSAASDKEGAKGFAAQIEPVWKGVEGTVKANDADAYLAFEDAFAALGKAANEGDASRAKSASTSVTKTVAAYLAAHPG